MLLVGDIGGTTTKLSIYSPDKGPKSPLIGKIFPSAHYPTFEKVLKKFLRSIDIKIEQAVFAVAGPVIENKVSITNLPWEIDKEQLQNILQIQSIRLINDLEALGHAVPFLNLTDDTFILNQGNPDSEGNIAVIAPGTGLGEAFLTKNGDYYKSNATEGGHVDFAPTSPLQIKLLEYLGDRSKARDKFKHVSYEKVCSGLGIPQIYEFLKNYEGREEPAWLAEKLLKSDDKTPVIVNTAIDEQLSCKICTDTLDLFISILGAEAGNLALKVKATRGVYLGGGIPPRIISVLKNGKFMEAFKQKGKMSYLMKRIPVYVILKDDVVRMGAAHMAFNPKIQGFPGCI